MAATIALLAGCSASRLTYRYDDPADPIVGEDYEYYPAHEAYYSPDDRTFIYRDGGSWVRSGDPPPGWQANSPSVRVHFRDSPEAHHQDVARRYPRTWRPPETRLGLEVDPRPSFDAKAER